MRNFQKFKNNRDAYNEQEMLEQKKMDLALKCERMAIEKLLTSFYHDRMLDDPGRAKEKWILDEEYKEFEDYCHKRTGGRYKYIMFTINFREDALLKDIKKKIEKCVKKTWIEKYMYNYETRNKEGEGLHIHLKCWIKDGKKPYDCKREVYNTFKHLVGNKMHVNCRYSNKDGCFEDYIKGLKEGEPKKNYRNDMEFRKIKKLDHIYKGEKL